MNQSSQTIIVETPEHFELRFQLAGIGSRFLAYLIDRFVQLAVILSLILLMILTLYMVGRSPIVGKWLATEAHRLGAWILAVFVLVEGVISAGYFMLFEYFWNGTTPGKRSQSIRVIRANGRPVTLIEAMLRNILRFVDILGGLYPLGLVVMFLDSRNRRLGDLTAGTLVVEDSAPSAPVTETQVAESAPVDVEFRKAVAALSNRDYALLTKFLARRDEMDPNSRRQITRHVYSRVFGGLPSQSRSPEQLEQDLIAAEALYRETTRIL